MRRFWTTTPDCSVYEAVGLECLATPLRIAFEVWGYGEVVAPAADVHSLVLVPVATPVSEPAHDEWDGARLLARPTATLSVEAQEIHEARRKMRRG